MVLIGFIRFAGFLGLIGFIGLGVYRLIGFIGLTGVCRVYRVQGLVFRSWGVLARGLYGLGSRRILKKPLHILGKSS